MKKKTPKDLVESLLNEDYKEGQRVILKAYPKGDKDFPDGLPEERGTIEGVEGKGMFVVRVDDKYLEDGDDGLREVHADQIQGPDDSKGPGRMTTWQDAQKAIPRMGPAGDDVMNSAILSDGTPIFAVKKSRIGPSGSNRSHHQWFANASASKIVRTAYDLCNGFVGENGGPVTHQMVAMFSYAVEADNAAGMPKKDIEMMTAGFEEGSREDKAQKKLGAKYPNVQAAILSFF
jgi:hypothetical protein